jgi:hypothetical protein
MRHPKSVIISSRLLVTASLAILFAVLSWSSARASATIQAAAPITAATQAMDASVTVSMPISGTMPMQAMDQGAMHGRMPVQGVSQPEMVQMMTMMAEMHRMMAQMYSMMAGDMATQGAMPVTPSNQATVHDMGGQVMPFDLSRTTHIFEMTDSGGIQQVIAKDPNDTEQIALIQQHLQHEATLFGAGDFSDPMALHGADMPGIKDLRAAAGQVKVEYSALPNGAQIAFTTEGIHLITALHRWFGAQLSDHGVDATYR